MDNLCKGTIVRKDHYWKCRLCGLESSSWDTKHRVFESPAKRFKKNVLVLHLAKHGVLQEL